MKRITSYWQIKNVQYLMNGNNIISHVQLEYGVKIFIMDISRNHDLTIK